MVEFFNGSLEIDGVVVEVQFQAPVGASVAEKDAAFMAALAQKARVEYVSTGTADQEPATVTDSTSASKTSVQVKHWDCYHSEYETANTHQMDIEDQRENNGQAYLTVGALEGDLDDMISVTAEVNADPLNEINHVPCLHVHFDESNLAFSLFKIGTRILLRPETGVQMKSFTERDSHGFTGEFVWVD